MEYQLEKLIWTAADFEKMGWHDSKVYAIAFDPDDFTLLLDIDYIYQWVNPQEGEEFYKFWISPATLVFENVWDLTTDIGSLDISILDILKENPQTPRNAKYIHDSIEYDWIIDLNSGQITFKSIGFKQYTRRKPVFSSTQYLGLKKRNGVSFEKPPLVAHI
jgi:hypothetical protein